MELDRRGFLKCLVAAGVAPASFWAWCAEHGADYDFFDNVAKSGMRLKEQGRCFG